MVVETKFVTSKAMLDWQYFQILGDLSEIQRHDSDPTCPCRLSTELGENCLAKHSLMLSVIAAETAAMDEPNRVMFATLSEEAKGKHEGMKLFLCDPGKESPEFTDWSRQWRKKIEPLYYHQSCHMKLRQEFICNLHQEPKVKISGSCTAKRGCSLKVKGAVETVQNTTALGSTSLTRYELRYKIREAKSLIPSNDPITFEPNPAYPQDLQPRLRGRAANKAQVLTMAANLDPDALLDDFHSIDRGAPIVDDNGVVLSGNGRVMAIQHAVSEFPSSYAVYKEHLIQAAPNYGLKLGKIQSPVLVRELVSKVDRRTFVEEANASTTIAASAIEIARSDAQKITVTMLNSLEVADGQGVEDALRSSANATFVSSFLSKLSANERAGVADAKGMLSQDGIRRITMAIFVNVFPGDVGIRLAEKFFESTDINVRNVFNGIVGALGKLAQSEALARGGQRNADLQIGDDLARAVVAFSDIKKTPGMTVEKYLAQSQMFERQLNEFQEKLLSLIDKRSRSGKKVAALLKTYAGIVIESPPPAQGALIPGTTPTKDQFIDAAVKRSEEPETVAMLQETNVCESLNFALDAEHGAMNEYNTLAAQAKRAHFLKDDVERLKGIEETEKDHHLVLSGIIERNCGGATMYETDPLLEKIHMELCPGILPCLLEPKGKISLPICISEQRENRENCIQDLKARNREAGCSREEGTGSKKCPSVFKVCTASIGCRLGRAKERVA